MRGADIVNECLFRIDRVEDFIPANHPLRDIRSLVDDVLRALDSEFQKMYAPSHKGGQPSIAPEKLIRASLLQALCSIRSERRLMEEIQYNLLYRWFVGLGFADAVWDATVFCHNRDRLLEHGIVDRLFEHVVHVAGQRGLLSNEHFSVDGTQLLAWASHKSFKPREQDSKDQDADKDQGNGGGSSDSRDWRGTKRSNATHSSTTDSDARNYRKCSGVGAYLSYLAHIISDNRHGLISALSVTTASGTAERDAAVELLQTIRKRPGNAKGKRITLGADKNYDTKEFVEKCRKLNVTAHVAQNTKRNGGSAIDGRVTRHEGYAMSQNKRKTVEQPFGWAKQIGGLRQTVYRGIDRVKQHVGIVFSAYNLLRICNLTRAKAVAP